jgi:hypothetical protein
MVSRVHARCRLEHHIQLLDVTNYCWSRTKVVFVGDIGGRSDAAMSGNKINDLTSDLLFGAIRDKILEILEGHVLGEFNQALTTASIRDFL